MSNPSIVSSPRTTNVDINRLASSEAVCAFMARVAHEFCHPLTGEVFVNSLAEATANTFGLFHDDGFTLPAVLYEVAASIARRRRRARSR